MEFKHWYGVEEKDEREFSCGILVKEHESSFFAERGGLLDGRVLNTIVGFDALKPDLHVEIRHVSDLRHFRAHP